MMQRAFRDCFRSCRGGRALQVTALVSLLFVPFLGAQGAAETVMDTPQGDEAALEATIPPERFRPGLGLPRAPSDLPPSGEMCSVPTEVMGSIVYATSPQFLGRLIRNGVPSICGPNYACSGVQSTSTLFAYEEFPFLNSGAETQCVSVSLDASACTQQVYSAAYLDSFDPNDLCANIQGAMGFSTSNTYGYSFLLPPGHDFVIANNTTGIVPPSSDCVGYTMTVGLCDAVPDLALTQDGAGLGQIRANSLGGANPQIPVSITNMGNFLGKLDATAAVETVDVSVADGLPDASQATFGHAGAIVRPGGTVTQDVPLVFSGSPFQCRPRFYQVDSALSYTLDSMNSLDDRVYYCNGFNPPSAEVVTGSVLPDDSFDEDALAFEAAEGNLVTVTVDTVSAADAFDIEACVSDTPQGDCLPGLQADDSFACTFPPPSFSCPRIEDATDPMNPVGIPLPADSDGDGIYYIRINSGSGASNFAGPVGAYQATLLVTGGPSGACPLVPSLDNGLNSFGATPVPGPLVAEVTPVRIVVPASDPTTCPTDLLLGKKLQLKGDPGGGKKNKKKLKVLAKDAVALDFVSAEDPTALGGSLRVVVDDPDPMATTPLFDDSYLLPAEGWRLVGKPGKEKGWKYKDKKQLFGPIQSVQIVAGKKLKVAGKGEALGHEIGDAPPGTVHVVLTAGDRQLCLDFGGTVKFDAKKLQLTAVNALAPAACPTN
jgi:hypothetical protein